MIDLVRDLQKPRPGIYWLDLLLSAAIGWAALAVAVTLFAVKIPGWYVLLPTLLSVLALYRALCFIHEISHQSPRSLPGFEAVWNLTTGFPLLLPSLVYAGVHSNHHRLSTYGTENDPEYLPFARSARMTVAFAAQSLLLPAAFAVRFLLLAPVAFLAPRFDRWLMVHSSSLSMNVRYRREVTPEVVLMIHRQSAGIVVMWVALIACLPMRFFVFWYVVSASISLINSLRTLGAHAYRSDGIPLSRDEQLRDSVDTPARRWGVLWAPVGLRFHALHHYFPGIPYHNLGEAYRRLTTRLPPDATIYTVRSKGLWSSLNTLVRAGLRREA
jgi:fatty acid desaturase